MTVGIRRLLTSNQRIRDAFHAALHRDADLDAALAALAPDAKRIRDAEIDRSPVSS
jgi:hypothetical protein